MTKNAQNRKTEKNEQHCFEPNICPNFYSVHFDALIDKAKKPTIHAR